MEIAIDELPVMSHMHYYIRIYGASAVNHVTYFYAAAQLLLITVAVAALSVLWISPEDEMMM